VQKTGEKGDTNGQRYAHFDDLSDVLRGNQLVRRIANVDGDWVLQELRSQVAHLLGPANRQNKTKQKTRGEQRVRNTITIRRIQRVMNVLM
jgi:hypothetical protein